MNMKSLTLTGARQEPQSPRRTLVAHAGLLSLAILAAFIAPAAVDAYTPATPTISGALTNGDCVQTINSSNYSIGDAGGPCQVPVQSTNYSIAAVGGNYTSVRSAYAAVMALPIAPGANIALNVAAGSYTDATPLTITSRFGRILSIAGAPTIAHTLTGIVSSTGSAGAYSIVLQMGEAVTNITANVDYIIVANASGGTNPTYMDGVFAVTAVNSGSNQITVTSLSQASSAPSGPVSANVTDVPTVLHWTGVSGIQVYGQSALQISNVVIVGDGTANQYCIDEEDVSRLYIPGTLGLSNCGSSSGGSGLLVNYNSEANFGSGVVVAISGGRDPLFVWGGGQVQPAGGTLVVTGGLGSGAATDGNIRVESGGYVNAQNAIVSGGLADGMIAQNGGYIFAENSFATGNAFYGYQTWKAGFADILNSTSSNNGSGASDVAWKPTNGVSINTSSGSSSGNITVTASQSGSGTGVQVNTSSRSSSEPVTQVLGNSGSHTVYAQGQVAQNAQMTIGSAILANASNGEIAIAKTIASGAAPGAGYLKFSVVTGTNAGSCKIIAYAGTSSTPVTVVDNVGSGC